MGRWAAADLKNHELGGLIAACAGGILVALTFIPHDPAAFWADWIRGIRGTGWMALLIGAAWLALASATLRTRFFSLEHKISIDQLLISLLAIAIVTGVLSYLAASRVPKTDPSQMPPVKEQREKIARLERNFRGYVAVAIVAVGMVVAVFPCAKYLRR
jgi:hypothetical protein